LAWLLISIHSDKEEGPSWMPFEVLDLAQNLLRINILY